MSDNPTDEQLKTAADDYVETLLDNPEEAIDLSKVQHKEHIWVDRGAKWSCETSTHECHAVWKPLRR